MSHLAGNDPAPNSFPVELVEDHRTDPLLSRTILFVALVALLDLGGIIALALFEKGVPSVMDNTLTGAVTGLVALLAARRT